MADKVEQNDEIFALQSIYNEEEFKSTIGEDGLQGGSFSAFVNLPPGFHVIHRTIENGVSKSISIPINHLPPILLSFKLPKDYPSRSMPQYTLSCSWLSVKMCKKLCDKLETLWHPGFVVLFTWNNFLTHDSLKELGVKDQLLVKSFQTPKHSEKRLGCEPNQPSERDDSRYSQEENPRDVDPRIVMPKLEIPLHRFLKEFNDDQKRTIFMKAFHECEICFEHKPGRDCIPFSPCGHTYCKDCMAQYFEVRIMDGMVKSMPCPSVIPEKCESEAFPQQIKDAVGILLFEKYDSLLLSITLDNMDDVMYCPRTSCQSAVIRDGVDKMATCPACRFVFCIFCRRGYHGIESCWNKSDKMRKIVEDYEEGDAITRANLEKRYGRSQIQRFVYEMLSDDWIKSNSKNCPKCDVSIEKQDGCNKMVCSKCGTDFCWLCLTLLNPNSPYSHFKDSNSSCRDLLFLGLGIDDIDDFDVYIDEEGFLQDLPEDDAEFVNL